MKRKIGRIISSFFILFYKLRYGRRVQFGKNILINHRFKIKGNGKLTLGDNLHLWAHEEPNAFHFYHPNAQISIGHNTTLNGITCHCYTKISIGDHCLAGSAIVMDTDFHNWEDPGHVLHGQKMSKPVSIGEGVWLGGQCAVLKGIQIGDGAVVGFRAVVTKEVNARSVVAGNPAKEVKSSQESSFSS